MWTVVLLLIGICVRVSSIGAGIDKCSRQPESSTVRCQVRILDVGGSSIEKVHPEITQHLYIDCNNLLFFESNLQVNYFKKLIYLDSLHVNNCKLLRIPGNTFESLRQLKRLSVRTRNAEWSATKSLELSLGAFNGQKELQVLDLSYNNIKTLPSDVFCPLDNVHTLNLTHNRIKTIDRFGFGYGCGANIQNLDLSYNLIHTLEQNTDINRLKRLQNLYLQHNNISKISSEAFSGLSSMRILNMSNNHIQSLPENVFANNKDLREIYLCSNEIYEFGHGVFQRLEQLLVLDLTNNKLLSNHINENSFLGLIRLIVLRLTNNSLTRIETKTFKDLFFLQILDLRNNSIGFIEENTFLPLYNLHTLNLAENRLYIVEEFLFNGLYVLSKLSVNNNLLTTININAFKNCSDLKELDISSNQLTHIPQAIWKLPSLKTLDLGENLITEIKNGSFKNLGQLTGLRMIENQIENLTVGMFSDLPNLQVLNLAKNKIQGIEHGTFYENKQLEAIRLDGNFISDINGVFSTLKSLLWLNLSENHLVWFDYAFMPMSLKWLDIHGNFIEHLANYYKIKNEIRVKTLDASHNRIREISSLSIPDSVELLFINNNFITNIHYNTFVSKVNLTRVDVYSNEITRLELKSLLLTPVQHNRSLPEFYVGGNPFDCDCRMEWFPIVNNMSSSRQYPRMMDLENVMCKLTQTRRTSHMPLTSMKSSDFLCKYSTHCFALCHCCDFDACDCEMTCPQNCTCYHDSLWSSNIVDCSGQRVNEIPQRIPMDATVVYLDGNDFKMLPNNVFIGRKNMHSLYANASGIEFIQNKTFISQSSLIILHLEKNKLSHLNGYEFDSLTNLENLYLQNNMITFIANTTFISMNALKVLRLDGNRLTNLNIGILRNNEHLKSLFIGNNLWSCKCSYLQELTSYIAINSATIADIADIFCWNSDSSLPRKNLILNGTVCNDYYVGDSITTSSNYLSTVMLIIVCFAFTVLCFVSLLIYRGTLRVWLSDLCGVKVSYVGTLDDNNKLYDAYVCYSPKDDEFVTQSICSQLENSNPSYRLCLHYRDIAHHGAPYMQCSPPLLEAAQASKRVIIVLTRNFIQTEWSRFEFRQAFHEALSGVINKLIIIEDSSAFSELSADADFTPYSRALKIKWGVNTFWKKFKHAMPEYILNKGQNGCRRINTYTLDSPVANEMIRSQHDVENEPDENGCRQENQARTQTAQFGVYERNGRPRSEHIYSSIDSDYSTLECSSSNNSRNNKNIQATPSLVECDMQGRAYYV